MKILLFSLAGVIAGGMIQRASDTRLTLRDAVDVMASYEIYHPTVPIRSSWYGWTDPDEQRIFVIKNADLATRRQTSIHELLHVTRKYKGVMLADQKEEEEIVGVAAQEMYKELFGEP